MPAPPISEAGRRNPVPTGRGAPLPLQRQVFEQAQRRARTGRGRDQAFNLTAEQAEASEKVIAGTIMVHSILIVLLFNSGAFH